jgi:hypothetical protein
MLNVSGGLDMGRDVTRVLTTFDNEDLEGVIGGG